MSSIVKTAANSITGPAQKYLKKSEDRNDPSPKNDNDKPSESDQPAQDQDSNKLSVPQNRKAVSALSRQNSSQSVSIIKYIVDSIDSIVDQICQRVLSIPIQIRYFAKAIYDE